MIYSVFDYGSRKFKYYEGMASVPTTGWFRPQNGGQVPESIAAQVPPGARFAGTGVEPRGLIATLNPALGSDSEMVPGDEGSSKWTLRAVFGVFVLGVYVGWRARA